MFLAILQARCSSSRLPNKVLRPIMGKPMLQLQIERLRRSRKIDKLVVATSDQPSDDPLALLCEDQAILCYRGSLDDVLDRFYQAHRLYQADHIIRLTGDCPLADPEVIDLVIAEHVNSKADYTSNTLEPSYPDGLDVEVFKSEALERAWAEAQLCSEREHVTPYIIKNSDLFMHHKVQNPTDLSGLRWTVDNPEDFDFVTKVYESLYPNNVNFDMQDVLDLLGSKPELVTINAHLIRNMGYSASLRNDKKINKQN